MLADLEATLAVNWSLEQLAVYGDYLQSVGDPRGELVAIDLHAIEHGSNPELAARKRALIDRWLGPPLAARVLAGGSVHTGFVHVAATPHAVAILDSAAGRYVRSLAIGDDIVVQLAALVRAPRPWLDSLAIAYTAPLNATEPLELDPSLGAALVAATPRLDTLDVHWDTRSWPADGSIRGVLAHPRVRRLVFSGPGALGWLADDAFPALRELDLSRAEPGNPLKPDVFGWMLRRIPRTCARIARLKLPSVRTDRDVDALERAIAGMRADAEIIVARGYSWFPTRALPPRVRAPRPWPWPAPEAPPGWDGLEIRIPGSPGPDVVAIRQIIPILEAAFDALPDDARAAWTELWAAVRQLGNYGEEPPVPCSAAALARALAAVDISALPSWTMLRDALAGRTSETVGIVRQLER